MFFADRYTQEITRQRQSKDRWLRTDPDSPLPWPERRQFSGLPYFPISRGYVVTAQVEPLHAAESVGISTSDGNEQWYRRAVLLHFTLDRQALALTGFLSEHDHGHAALFVPFRDALAGRETYGAGRYLDVDAPTHGVSQLTLDFNLAYNPYCAYSDAYSCPVPPRENWLAVAIRAGERVFQPH